MNKATLIGRLAADPELRQTGSGIAVTSFTIAVDRPYVKGSDRQTDWIDIVAWRNTAEFVCKYFQKGSPIIIEGSIQTRRYQDKNGNNRTAFEVVANNVQFVESKRDGVSGDAAPASFSTSSYRSPEVTVAEISNEGVLCVSSPSNEGWGEETPDW